MREQKQIRRGAEWSETALLRQSNRCFDESAGSPLRKACLTLQTESTGNASHFHSRPTDMGNPICPVSTIGRFSRADGSARATDTHTSRTSPLIDY